MRGMRHLAMALGLLGVLLLGIPVTAQQELPVEIVPPGEEFGGATAAEWEARWWQWALSIPAESNPNLDPTGASCGTGQFGPVFLLPGVFIDPEMEAPAPFNCTVPEGVGIYVPIAGAGCSTVEPPPYFGANDAELTSCATAGVSELITVEVTIDGVPVADVDQYHHVTDPYVINFVPNNMYDVDPPVVATGVSEAWGFVIEPPAPGTYVIELTNQWEGMDAPLVISYNIEVKSPSVIVPEASPAASPAA